MSEKPAKPIIAISFIGCVAQNYDKDGSIVPGFFNWAVNAFKYFTLLVYSNQIPLDKMESFVRNFQIPWRHQKLADNQPDAKDELSLVYVETPPLDPFLLITDRSITFTGRWDMPFLNPVDLIEFKPWMEPHILYKLPEDLNRPDAQQRAASVAPPPDALRKCPKHPWMTKQNPDGSRECMITTCSWKSAAPPL